MALPWRSGGVGELPGTPWTKYETANTRGWLINLTGGDASGLEQVPFDTPKIIDWLRLCVGPIRWKPRDVSLVVPFGQAIPELPPGYDDGMIVPMLFQGLPLAKLTSTGAYVNNALYTLHMVFTFAAEAQRGLLPVYVSEKSEPVFNAKYNQNFYPPKEKLAGWVERDSDLFGPALVPVPVPLIGRQAGEGNPNTAWPAALQGPPGASQAPEPATPPSAPAAAARTAFPSMVPAAGASGAGPARPKILPVP
jgi:hypothetical protein